MEGSGQGDCFLSIGSQLVSPKASKTFMLFVGPFLYTVVKPLENETEYNSFKALHISLYSNRSSFIVPNGT